MLSRTGTLLLLVLGFCASARADDAGFFPKGTWTVTGYSAYTRNFINDKEKIVSGTMGVGYYFFDNISLNAEVSGYHVVQNGPDSNIANFEAVIRQHLWHSGRFSFYIDGGAGLAYASHRTPYYGTYYNYILEFGVGATFQIYENLNLMGGVRYFHLSNADLEGPLHNPGINATQGYIGLMLKF